jgi:hypothetical protein
MKTIIFAVFAVFIAMSAFCNGNSEPIRLELVNTQEIGLDRITGVKISYSYGDVSVFIGTKDTLIIKEYISENDSRYFAKIANSGNTVTIGNGERPSRPSSNTFGCRIEVYLPLSYRNTINVNTSGGSISCTVGTQVRHISLNTTSGNIRLALPRDLNLNFSSRTTYGMLSTPFSDRLLSPVSDRNSTQGFIGTSGSAEIATVNIRTSGGSIRVAWR